MSAREAYEKKLRGRLDEWRADIARLKAQAEQAEGDAQLAYYKEIEELRARQDAARDRLDELRDASDDAWDDVKAGAERAWSSLSESLERARTRFK